MLKLNPRDNGNEYSSAAPIRLIFDYDSLVIATGARSAVPKIKGIFVNDDTSNQVIQVTMSSMKGNRGNRLVKERKRKRLEMKMKINHQKLALTVSSYREKIL